MASFDSSSAASPGAPRFAILTLGCRVNQYESGVMRRDLATRGLVEVPFEEAAECYVINTCTVTHLADRKSRQMIRRALRLNPAAHVFAVGCGALCDGEAFTRISGRIVVLSNEEKHTLAERAAGLLSPCAGNDAGAGSRASPAGSARAGQNADGGSPVRDGHGAAPSASERTRALLKVQDGCSHRCSYCIVPSVRGPARSRTCAEALLEAQRLEARGHREIVVTGIHLSAWGVDLPGRPGLEELLETLLEGTGDVRFRLSSLEPQGFPHGVLPLMTATRRLCPHLHLPLQHASDAVLARMRRGYTSAGFRALVEEFHGRFPLGGLSTDVLVGFPGETEADVERLEAFIEELPFTRLHVFKYSPRPGTPAAQFPDQVQEAAKDERSRRIIRLGRAKAVEFARRNVGSTLEVLVESELMKGTWEGTSDNYAPVLIDSSDDLGGMIVPVLAARSTREQVLGRVQAQRREERPADGVRGGRAARLSECSGGLKE